jgi:hypothetical protein
VPSQDHHDHVLFGKGRHITLDGGFVKLHASG